MTEKKAAKKKKTKKKAKTKADLVNDIKSLDEQVCDLDEQLAELKIELSDTKSKLNTAQDEAEAECEPCNEHEASRQTLIRWALKAGAEPFDVYCKVTDEVAEEIREEMHRKAAWLQTA